MIFVVLSGFGASLLAPLLHRHLPRWSGWLCALSPGVLFVSFIFSVVPVTAAETARESYSWIPFLGVELSFKLDGLSLLFALTITGIGILVVTYASVYLRGHRHLGRFYGLILAFMTAMLGTVLAGDLMTMFVFWELTGLTSYLLIGFDHGNQASRAAALQALLVTVGGGLALLAGIILLGHISGSMDFEILLHRGDLIRGHALYPPVLALILIGAFSKSAQFPFHFWLPGAMAAPTPVSAYLHSATMVNLGVYLLARLSPILGGTEAWFTMVAPIGGITMIVGGVMSLVRQDLKQILAYSTVGALGTLTLMLGLGTPTAIMAAMFLLPVHALYKSSLFLAAGAVDHGAGAREINRLGGLANKMPWVAVVAGLAALSMAGLPPFGGFVAKELLYEANIEAPLASGMLAAAGVVGSAFTVAAAALAGFFPFYGRQADPHLHPHRVEASLWLPPFLPALAGLAMGIWPDVAGRWLVIPAAVAVQGAPVSVELALWHGFNPVFLLSILTIGAGFGLAMARAPFLRWLPSLADASMWGPERVYGLLFNGTLELAKGVTRFVQHGRLRCYLMTVVGVTFILIVIAVILNKGIPEQLPRPDGGVYEWLTCAVILASACMAAFTRSRLAAVAAVGAVGYGVALIYILFGAPDLAMTQFCIETLSIILFVLVLHRLPVFTRLSTPLARMRDIIVSLSLGGLMTLLVMLAVSQPLVPHISSWFMEQSLPAAHGRNVVNVILVDFRAMDTLGEITVLAVAALGVYGLMKSRRIGE